MQDVEEFVNGGGGSERSAEAPAPEARWSEDEWRQWNAWRGYSNWWADAADRGTSSVVSGPPGAEAAAAREGNEVLDQPAAAREQWWQPSGWSAADPWTSWRGGWSDWSNYGKWQSSKGDYGDPPSWGGWPNYRLWKRSMVRWNANTDVVVWRRAEKVLKNFDWEMQQKLEHLSEEQLSASTYLTDILAILDVLAGEKEASERRRQVRAALYEGNRRSDETLAQYALRRESQFASANQYLAIPDELKGFMMEEQAGLNKQGLQNLRVLTNGSSSFSQVKKALQILDTEEEALMKSSGRASYYDTVAEAEEPSWSSDGEEEHENEMILFALEQQDMDEDKAMSFVTEWKTKKKTWSENKTLKASQRKDRRHFDDRTSRPGRPQNRRRLPISELKKITRCRRCNAKGHWEEDCDQPKSRAGQSSSSGTSNMVAFTYCSTGTPTVAADFFNMVTQEAFSFLEIPPGYAIVDPGASQDLIGFKAYQKLEERLKTLGLRPVKLQGKPQEPSGIGGKAKPLFCSLVPCFLAGQPGIVRMTIIQDDIPHLISIGLLEHGKAVIDTDTNRVHFKSFDKDATMVKIDSGHRILDVASWNGGRFDIPRQLLDQYGLKPDAFEISPKECGQTVYMCSRGSGVLDAFVSEILGDSRFEGLTRDVFGNHVVVGRSSKVFRTPPIKDSESFPWRISWVVNDGKLSCLEGLTNWVSLAEPHEIIDCSFHAHVTLFLAEPNHPLLEEFQSFAKRETTSCENIPHEGHEIIEHGQCHDETCCKAPRPSHSELTVDQNLQDRDQSLLQRHEAERGTVQVSGDGSCAIREPSRVGSVKVVCLDQEASQCLVGDGEHCASAGNGTEPEAKVSSPTRSSGEWGKSIWDMEEVQGLPIQDRVQALWTGEPPESQDQGEETNQGYGDGHQLCGDAAGDGTRRYPSSPAGPTCGFGNDVRGGARADDCPVASSGATDGPCGGHHDESGNSSFDAKPTSLAGDVAVGHDESSCRSSTTISRPRSATSSAKYGSLPTLSCRPSDDTERACVGVCRLPRGGAVRLDGVLQVSLCTDASSCWLVAPLSQASVNYCTSNASKQQFFYVNTDCGVWVVWEDRATVEDLMFSDANDDHEFQIRNRDKRSMLATISNNRNSFRHFASVASGGQEPDNLRTGKAIECTERAMEGPETAREPANPSTGRNSQTARVPVPRTEKTDEKTVNVLRVTWNTRTHTHRDRLDRAPPGRKGATMGW